MKNFRTVLAVTAVLCISLVLARTSETGAHILGQLAGVIGIDMESVYRYQEMRGINRDLGVGDSGEDVRLVQEALVALTENFPEENITGYFGAKTSAALAEYQKETDLPVTGTVDTATQTHFNTLYFTKLCPQARKKGPFKNEILVEVNKDTALPKKYVPHNLIDVSSIVKTTSVACLKREVVSSLKKMMRDASRDGVTLAVTSGFRRPEIQGILQDIWTAVIGEEATERSVAEPSHSEHQLGTTIDLSGASNGFRGGDSGFGGTPESEWLQTHGHEYGFVMSYPAGKENVTGYIYEPWHYRFLGKEAAREIFKKKISVEEYFGSHSGRASGDDDTGDDEG
ncbi:D-alanyl-D-alanine carboxypeptidase family protein [Candidatus Kaiserbacteria bacterium]|nr:D-alanyl-D-alanine carboxypeptidase family protein [Candidatus Kaiserbacteria bacterium]